MRQRDIRQRCTFLERMTAYGVHTIRNDNGLQRRAVVECVLPDGCQILVQRYAGQFFAAVERVFPDGSQFKASREGFQRGTAIESILRNALDLLTKVANTSVLW